MIKTENAGNGKWFPLKDKKFRLGYISSKLIVIKLTEKQTSGTIEGRHRTIRWRERRETGSRERTENHQWHCGKDIEKLRGRQTTEKDQTDRHTDAKDSQ